jgi:hypothetical protein
MNNPVSIFIMDVSNSSYEDEFGQELTLYLREMVERISIWTDGIVKTKVKHRMGDEILLISENYSSAYAIAFHISRIWKYRNNKPYFGLSFGDVRKEIEDIDTDTWIHPLLKQARMANEDLKKKSNRPQFRFELDHVSNDKTIDTFLHVDENYRSEFETLFNLVLRMQQTHIDKQTELQYLICTLYVFLNQQKKVAAFLGKSPATISSHYKKGSCEEILAACNEIQTVLNSLQNRNYSKNDHNPVQVNRKLIEKIKSNINDDLDVFLS